MRPNLLAVVLSVGLSMVAATAMAAAPSAATGCAAKQESIQKELAIAREKGNKHRVAGLEKALKSAQECTDAELRSERVDKVRSAGVKVQERQAELQKEQADGDKDDIAKATRKLDEAVRELSDAQAQLSQ